MTKPVGSLHLFLDIDGVLYNNPDREGVFRKALELFPGEIPSSNRSCSIAASLFFDQKALNSLDYLIEEIAKTKNVYIVISSSWREKRTAKELKSVYFQNHKFSRYIVDKTPDRIPHAKIRKHCKTGSHDKKYTWQCRASEINKWIAQHPEVTDIAILDDNDDCLKTNFGEFFFQTRFNTLLTMDIAEKIVVKFTKTSL